MTTYPLEFHRRSERQWARRALVLWKDLEARIVLRRMRGDGSPIVGDHDPDQLAEQPRGQPVYQQCHQRGDLQHAGAARRIAEQAQEWQHQWRRNAVDEFRESR